MRNLKYHLINSVAVLVFSYTSATTVNSVVKYKLSPDFQKKSSYRGGSYHSNRLVKNFEHYQPILKSGLFKVAEEKVPDLNISSTPAGSVDDLQLMGTITGPWSIARAMIKKKGEKDPQVFALYKVDKNTTNDVYGYKLVRIGTSKVWLKRDGEKKMLDMFEGKVTGRKRRSSGGKISSKTISRSVLQQKLKNLDSALKGIVAGPYRRGGKIVGYKLKRVRSYNILYKFGLRSGDIIKRVNGHSVNNTGKLYQMWQNLKSENNIKIDYTRRGKLQTLQFNITD